MRWLYEAKRHGKDRERSSPRAVPGCATWADNSLCCSQQTVEGVFFTYESVFSLLTEQAAPCCTVPCRTTESAVGWSEIMWEDQAFMEASARANCSATPGGERGIKMSWHMRAWELFFPEARHKSVLAWSQSKTPQSTPAVSFTHGPPKWKNAKCGGQIKDEAS